MSGVAPQAGPGDNQQKLTTERIADGDITCVRFDGTIDEAFEGRKLASSIKARVLILDMGRVAKVSSFGIREWSEFIKGVERSVDQIYLIECTAKVVDQINMVANFVGKAKVVSFYGPYRCDFCDIDEDVLFQVDRDSAAIRSFNPPEHLCGTCARPQFFDEDPASYMATIAQQPQFDLAEGVPEFLSSKLNYSVSGGNRRLQINKYVEGRNTFLRLSGNLDGSFPSEKVAEGLEGAVVIDVSGLGGVDIAGAAEWRNFVTLARQGADRVYLLDCPPVLLDRLPRAEDLGDEVLTFSMPYTCTTCSTTTSRTVDVEEHFEILRFATPPEMRCETCKQPTTCAAQESLLSRLRSLPKPQVDAKLKAFIKAARKRKVEKAASEEEAAAAPAGKKTMTLVVGSLATLAVAAGVMVYYVKQQNKRLEEIAGKPTGDVPTADKRPAWITADQPFSAYCVDQVSRMSCVGISSFVKTKDEAREEARNVALEELSGAIAVKIESDLFDEKVRALYSEPRRRALLEFDNVLNDRASAAYKSSYETVRDARRRVAAALIASGGEAVPLNAADTYWERYEPEAGVSDTDEFRYFARYEISNDAVRALMDDYVVERDVRGGKGLTAFPLLAWSHTDFEGGVLVTDNSGKLSSAEVGDVVISIGGTPVKTAQELDRNETGGELVAATAVSLEDDGADEGSDEGGDEGSE